MSWGAHYDTLSKREIEALKGEGMIIDIEKWDELAKRFEAGERLTQRENAQFRIFDAVIRSQSVIPGMLEVTCEVSRKYADATLPRIDEEFVRIESADDISCKT